MPRDLLANIDMPANAGPRDLLAEPAPNSSTASPAAPAAFGDRVIGKYQPMTMEQFGKTVPIAEELAPLGGAVVLPMAAAVSGPVGWLAGVALTGLGAGAGQALVNMERVMRGSPEAPVSPSASAVSIGHQINTNMAWGAAGEALHGALSYAAKFHDGFLMHPLDSVKQWWMERQIGKGVPEATIENINRSRLERAMQQEKVGLTPGEQAADTAMIAQENQFMRGTGVSRIAAAVDTSRYETMSDNLLKRINSIANTGDIALAGKEQVGNEITKTYDELFNIRSNVGKQFQEIVQQGSGYKNLEAVDEYNSKLLTDMQNRISAAESKATAIQVKGQMKLDDVARDNYLKNIYGEATVDESKIVESINRGTAKAQHEINSAIDSVVEQALPPVPMIGSKNVRLQLEQELNQYIGKDLSSVDKATVRALNESMMVRQKTPFVDIQTFDRNLKVLREKFYNDGKMLHYDALDRIRNAAYQDLNDSGRWITSGLGEKYAAAVDSYKLASIPIDEFGDTLVGKMLKLEAPTPERLAEKLFTGKPTEVETIMNMLGKYGSPQTVQNVKALSMKRIYQESLADPGSGMVEGMVDPSKWVANFKKNKPTLAAMFKNDDALAKFEDANLVMAGLSQRGAPISGLPVEKEYTQRMEGYHVASGFMHSASNVARAGIDVLMNSFSKVGPERRLMFMLDPEAQQSLFDLQKAMKVGNQKLAAQRIDYLSDLVSRGGMTASALFNNKPRQGVLTQ